MSGKSTMPDAFQEIMSKNAAAGEEIAAVETPETPETPVVTETPETPVVETPETPETPEVTETPETPVTPETPEISETPEVEKEVDLSKWDLDIPDTPATPETPETPVIDFKDISKTLGKDITSLEQLTTEVKGLKDAQPSDTLAGIPDDLKMAVEIARKDGDYKSYLNLSQTDEYLKGLDSKQLYINKAAELFKNADGTVDKEQLAIHLENVDEVSQVMQGDQLKAQLLAGQEVKRAATEQSMRDSLRERETRLNLALSQMTEIRGFKLGDPHKAAIKDGVLSGKMISEMFYGADGNMDYVKVAERYFDYKYGEKANNFLRQQVQSQTKIEMLDKIGNADVVTPTPDVITVPPPKEETPQTEMGKALTGGFFKKGL